jgi:hypothetical protein
MFYTHLLVVVIDWGRSRVDKTQVEDKNSGWDGWLTGIIV